MLNKEVIQKKIKDLKLPREQFCIMTGAALVLHGVKEYTRDIDISCTDQLFECLAAQGYAIKKTNSYEGITIDGCVEVFRNWHVEKVVYIEDIPVADIFCIRQDKQNRARAKDLLDIELIDEFIAAKTNKNGDRCK